MFMDTRLGLRITRDSRGDTSVFSSAWATCEQMSTATRISTTGSDGRAGELNKRLGMHQEAASATRLCQCAQATCKRSILTCFWKAATGICAF